MDKGWCLTLENSDQVGFFGNKSVFGVSLSPMLNHRNTMFPVDSSGRGEQPYASSPPGREQPVVLGEVDFFSEKKRPIDEVNAFVIKKEINSRAETTTGRELNVNVSCL